MDVGGTRPSASAVEVRPATLQDAIAVARIYNQGIAERIATFETEPRVPEQIVGLLRERLPEHPAVVAVDGDGWVVGFAMTSPYSARPCYSGVAEYAVYVDRAHRGRGVGVALMDALAEACRSRGFWKLTSRIFPENTASLALCARTGFREVGVHVRHGRLDGEWRDTIVVEKLLD